jgi:alpha-tubulin suppressor-like RCC1 family protein
MTTADGMVVCWGHNEFGQDGDGTNIDRHVPVFVNGLKGITNLTAGSNHTCALNGKGEVWCWGENNSGQLGDNSTQNRSTPVKVQGLPGPAVFFTAGKDFTCANLDNGQIWCWGENQAGQLNDGSTVNRLTAVKTNFSQAPNQISGGINFLLGETGGTVSNWENVKPVIINQLESSIAISANRWSPGGCAVTLTGQVKCWGSDLMSAGIMDAANSLSVGSGWDHACAINSDFTVSCWGQNIYGELGDGTKLSRSTAAPVKNLPVISALAVGAHHACVLTAEGEPMCWGRNIYGQNGDNSTIDRTLPVKVRLPSK